MTLLWIILVTLLVALSYPLARTWLRFRGTQIVRCPQSGSAASIELDAGYAAASQASCGTPMLRVTRCSRWPRHQDCDQECLAQIATV
jgi:hypothetical protein